MDEQTFLQQVIYNPDRVQNYLLSKLENDLNIDIPDPTNSFIYMLENSVRLSAAVANEFATNMRKLYPALASTYEDLYGHLTTDELTNIFAVPSEAIFRFFINKNDFIALGVNTGNYISGGIPSLTVIKVDNTIFTTLEDIEIRLYNNNKLYVEKKKSVFDIGSQYSEVIDGGVMTDDNNVEWIYLDLPVKQVKYNKIIDTVNANIPFKTTVPIEDKFVYTRISLNNSPSKITLSNFVYNPDTITFYIKPKDNQVDIELPIIYTAKGVSGEVTIEMFTSKGKTYLNLESYDIDNISVNLPDTTGSISKASIFAKPLTNAAGGRDPLTFEELKELIITHSTGDNDTPITDEELEVKFKEYGFEIRKYIDHLFNREYLASTEIGTLNRDVNVAADPIVHPVEIDPVAVDNYKIVVGTNRLIINPFNNFTLVGNKLVPVFKDITKDDIEKQKYYYNIYKYIADYGDELEVRAYDINQPQITNIKSIETNSDLEIIVNFTNYRVTRLGNAYTVIFDIVSDTLLDTVRIEDLRVSMQFTNSEGNGVEFRGDVFVDADGIHGRIKINTTGYIDKDHMYEVTNFYDNEGSLINLTTSMPILSDAYVVLYTVADYSQLTKNSLSSFTSDTDAKVVLNVEIVSMELAIYLEYLFTNYNLEYTSRKYKTYDDYVYLTYKEDVYETDETGTPVFTLIDTDGDDTADDIEFSILHHAGDKVLDSNGNPIVLHAPGDIMYDENGNPIIDTTVGIRHVLDILVLEKELAFTQTNEYLLYRVDLYKELTNISTIKLAELNEKLLENTVVRFKPKASLKPVEVIVNGKVIATDPYISPTVNIYVEDNILSPSDIEDIRKTCSRIIQHALYVNKSINAIENDLKESLPENIIGLKVTGLDNLGDIYYKTLAANSNIYLLNKKLILDTTGNTIMVGDIKIIVNTISA